MVSVTVASLFTSLLDCISEQNVTDSPAVRRTSAAAMTCYIISSIRSDPNNFGSGNRAGDVTVP